MKRKLSGKPKRPFMKREWANLFAGRTGNIFRTAFLLFVGYVDAVTTFAQNCGGGGSAPDPNWGRDKNEDDILWARSF